MVISIFIDTPILQYKTRFMNNSIRRTLLILTCAIASPLLFAQTSVKEEIPKGWHLLDKGSSGYYGISLDKAYEFIKSKKLNSKTVVVAVIDSGIDTTH